MKASSKKSTLEVLVGELREAYPDDPSAPGVMIAQIKGRRFYAAAVRFHRAMGLEREVVGSARASDLGEAIRTLTDQWRQRVNEKKCRGTDS